MRTEVMDMAIRMEHVLQANDDKEHWSKSSQNYLEHLVRTKHFDKLKYAVCANDHAAVIKQAVDISNYCLMLVDNAARLQSRTNNTGEK